jgi:hypothetical protein
MSILCKVGRSTETAIHHIHNRVIDDVNGSSLVWKGREILQADVSRTDGVGLTRLMQSLISGRYAA